MTNPTSLSILIFGGGRWNTALTLVLVSALAIFAMPSTQAQTLTVLHDFTGGPDGNGPAAGLTMDNAGNFYGTTGLGGTMEAGVVFKLTPENMNWILTPIYEFKGGSDGAQPISRVIFGPDGKLYGTTQFGGGSQSCDQGCGTVYSLTPPARTCTTVPCPWQETVLHSFSGLDGIRPGSGDLAFDPAGNIYGTTISGGAYYRGGNQQGYGTVFELSRTNGGWTESVIYSFTGSQDGGLPWAGVTFDNGGSLFGTTANGGGAPGAGTIYRLTPSGSGWTERTVYVFRGQGGSTPTAGLIMDQSGNFYGAATGGGPGGDGTVFELTPSGGSWDFNLLYGFSGNPSGLPAANLLLAGGNLYGTLEGEVDHDFGAVFELTPSNAGWNQIVLHQFNLGEDGGVPMGSLVMDSSGNLYGVANLGGTYGVGLVFQIAP